MLIKCPECELQVSDKAIVCPHCGYVLVPNKVVKVASRNKKRRKLPHGFGQITKINKQYLRKPYRAMVTVGKDPNGKPIQKPLKPETYFETYNEAYEALVEYNKNPYDLDADMTVKDLYVKWFEDSFKNVSSAYTRTITSSWAYCSSIYTMRVKDVRPRHIKGCMEEGFRIGTTGSKKGEKIYPSSGTKSRIKSLFNIMFDYALEHEIVQTNYARAFELSSDVIKDIEKSKRNHIPFTEDEMKVLWKNVGKTPFVDWIVIQCYMGWRPQELATIRLDEVNLEEWYMIAGMKTDAGRQRIVPIHSKIKDLVKDNYDKALALGSEYLFNDKGQTHSGSLKMTYDKYAHRFKKVIGALGLNSEHRPHDPRMTFITRGKRAGMDEYALKEMIGHTVRDITESVYTVRDVEWLREDIEKPG